jgi:hypothetical protein
MRRGLWIVALVAAGCAGPKVDSTGLTSGGGGGRDLATGDHTPKAPPVGTGGGPTASGCNGVTAKGRCEISDKGQVAVVCDVAGNKLQRFDCSAMSKVCVLDSARGATCTTLPPPATPPRDMATAPPPHDMATTAPARDMATTPPVRDMATAAPMCASGVDYRGYCASATGSGAPDTAIWCDPTTGQTLVVSCAARGQTCQIDVCADGAYCCDSGSVDMAQPATTTAECDTLGFAGECAGQVARWCSGGQIIEIDCAGRAQTCEVDTCASGAYCCSG